MCVESVGVTGSSPWEGWPEGGVGHATEAEGVSREIWLARICELFEPLRGSLGASRQPLDLAMLALPLPTFIVPHETGLLASGPSTLLISSS